MCKDCVRTGGKMFKGEELEVLEERMKTMDPENNEIYNFLLIEQADGIKIKKVFERVKAKVNKRVKMLATPDCRM